MQDTISLTIAIWGAILSTILAGLKVYDLIRDKGDIRVHAAVYRRDCPDEPERKFDNTVGVTIANQGRRAVQVLGVFFIDRWNGKYTASQIIPNGFPIVLQPEMAIEAEIQIQWLHYRKPVIWFGVVDALGRLHGLSDEELESLLHQAEEAPSTVCWFQRKDDPDKKVIAFQPKDKAVHWTIDPVQPRSRMMLPGHRPV
jgi:hypothetical protein